MHNVKTKLVALALAACLVAGFTSCAGGKTSSTASKTPASSDAASGTASGTTTEISYPLSKDKVTLTAYVADWGWSLDDLKNKHFTTDYEALTNVTIDWQIQSEWAQAIQLAVSSNTLPDLTLIGGGVSKTDMLQYGKAGYFVDLAKNLDKMPNLARALETYKDSNADVFTSVDGELYTAPNYVFTYSSSDQLAFTYFTDMAEELGYSKEKGNMPKTVDEFYTFLKAAQDKFGANDPEFHALRCKWGGMSFPQANLYTAFGPGHGGGFDVVNEGKTVRLGGIDDQHRHYLSFMNKCYEDGILNPDLFSEEKTSNIALVKAKKSMVSSVEMHNFSKDDFGGDWKLDYVGPFTSQWQDKAHTTTYCGSYGSFSNNAVSAKGKNVDIAMQWLDGLYADEDHPLTEGLWGISMWIGKEGTDWTWGDDKHETYKMLIDDEAIAGFWTGFNIVWPKVVVADDASFAQSKFQSANKEILANIEHDVAVEASKLTLTDEESEVVSTYAADINAAIGAAGPKFLTGEAGYDIDNDADWNAFVKSIQDMHTDDVIKAYQSALDRYNDSKAALNK